MDAKRLLTTVQALEPAAESIENANMPAVHVPSARLLPLLEHLYHEKDLEFDLLLSHTAVDWPAFDCFELVYTLCSTEHGHSLMVTSSIAREERTAPSVGHLWPTALWQEREVFDLFGILYDNHPDLRRLFLEDDWVGHPLRKDYKDPYMLERPR